MGRQQKKQLKQKAIISRTPKPADISQVRQLSRKVRDLSAYQAKQRDATTPLPAPFYSSAPVAKKAKKVVYSRQLQPDDAFYGAYDRLGLIVPPYSPTQLYSIYESSSILSPHIDALIQNVTGFDIPFKYIGPAGEKESDASKKEKEQLTAFFRKANESQSFRTVRQAMRLDYEVLGYGFMEITRSQDGEIACIYPVQGQYIRVSKLAGEKSQKITITLPRGGRDKPITLQKKFRRYAQVLPGAASSNTRWFKEYGDIRRMDAKTGKFEKDGNKVTDLASELIHFKNGNDTYGLPRWIGNVLGVIGVRSADYINYDLFDSQGIPPMVIMVSGGILTQDSLDTIEQLLRQAKGYQNFNRLLLLEAQSEGGIDDKMVPKVEMKSLSEARTEDAMFQKYISSVEEKLRMDFRLPSIYLGKSGDYNRSCYSEDTETLTLAGFKKLTDLSVQDRIATYNPEYRHMEFFKPDSMYIYPYQGDMVHFKSDTVDILVTPDHDMWAAPYGSCYRKEKAETIKRRSFKSVPENFAPSSTISEVNIFPLQIKGGTYSGTEQIKPIPIGLFMEFLGYYLSEGNLHPEYSCGRRTCQYTITISQKKTHSIEAIKNCVINVSKFGYRMLNPHQSSDETWRFQITSKSLYYWLLENCGNLQPDRYIPRDIFNSVNVEHLTILYDAMMLGDGSYDTRDTANSGYYSTSSIELADNFQELCVRIGVRSKKKWGVGCWRIQISEKVVDTFVSIQANNINRVDYNGAVYCFDVPNHLFITRRNGCITIQGNTVEFSRIIAEEQVFEPERNAEDEKYNNTIMQELDSKYWAFKSGRPPLVTGEGLMKGFDSMANAGVLTINQALGVANQAMGLDFEEIEEEWADYPVGIVNRLLDRGFFADLDQLIDVLEGNAAAINNPTVLLEGPAAGDTTNDDEIIDVDTKAQISKLLNSILNKAKDISLKAKIETENVNNSQKDLKMDSA